MTNDLDPVMSRSQAVVFRSGNLRVWQIGIRDAGYRELGLHVVNLDYNCSLYT